MDACTNPSLYNRAPSAAFIDGPYGHMQGLNLRAPMRLPAHPDLWFGTQQRVCAQGWRYGTGCSGRGCACQGGCNMPFQ